MTNTVLHINRSTNVVKNPLISSAIYFLAAYLALFYLLPLALDISNFLGAVIFSFVLVTFSLTILKPLLALISHTVLWQRVNSQERIERNRLLLS
jgi:hypothetical protein